MTQTRRIILNDVATYGRSLCALVIGLFCGRWVLMALGKSDFGLYGLIGGLAVLIGVFNTMLASAEGRYFGVAIGRSKAELTLGGAKKAGAQSEEGTVGIGDSISSSISRWRSYQVFNGSHVYEGAHFFVSLCVDFCCVMLEVCVEDRRANDDFSEAGCGCGLLRHKKKGVSK